MYTKLEGKKYIHKAGKWADAGSEDEEQPRVRKRMREQVAFVFCSWSCSFQCIGWSTAGYSADTLLVMFTQYSLADVLLIQH